MASETPKAAKSSPRRVKRGTRKSATLAKTDSTNLEEIEAVHLNEAPATSPRRMFSSGSVSHSEVTIFLRQLIMLLEAGTPILRSLKTLTKRGESAAIRGLVSDIAAYVEQGNPLWQAFDRHPRYFDPVFVNLIKASEASGTLVTVLRRMVDYREERELLRKRVRGALVYPIILVFACFGVLLLLTKFVVPEFEEMFNRAGLEIPPFTQAFLDASDILATWWFTPILLLFVLIAIYKLWYVRDPRRRRRADYIKLKIPVVGSIVHKQALVELTRTLSLLLRSGLSMMASLDLTRNAVHNSAVAQSLQGVRDNVEQGGGMEEPLRRQAHVVPHVVTDMIVTGEESGRVDQVCEQIANVYEEEVRIQVSTLGEALQPIFTVFIGAVVAFLFVALFFPLVSMIESIAGGGAM